MRLSSGAVGLARLAGLTDCQDVRWPEPCCCSASPNIQLLTMAERLSVSTQKEQASTWDGIPCRSKAMEVQYSSRDEL